MYSIVVQISNSCVNRKILNMFIDIKEWISRDIRFTRIMSVNIEHGFSFPLYPKIVDSMQNEIRGWVDEQ